MKSVAGYVDQQKLKYRQVKITKHASIGTNYAIVIKQFKVISEYYFKQNKKTLTNIKVLFSTYVI